MTQPYTLWDGVTCRLCTDKPFTAIDGTVVNPDVVTLTYSVQGITEVTYTWTNGNTPPDPNYKIVNDSTGYFHADISTEGLPGTWQVEWNGQPGGNALDSTMTSAIWVYEVLVSPTGL